MIIFSLVDASSVLCMLVRYELVWILESWRGDREEVVELWSVFHRSSWLWYVYDMSVKRKCESRSVRREVRVEIGIVQGARCGFTVVVDTVYDVFQEFSLAKKREPRSKNHKGCVIENEKSTLELTKLSCNATILMVIWTSEFHAFPAAVPILRFLSSSFVLSYWSISSASIVWNISPRLEYLASSGNISEPSDPSQS